ncbi:MAG: 4-hydroxybenzoate octaprenyltransferase [Paracoccaceae bacterium]|nr:4-hydroxybenzoate octaprenyltransferase [Paracoccaceae bacterium]
MPDAPQRPESAATAAGRVADAVANHWVDTAAPHFARPYLQLSRIDRPIGTWLLLLPCWWGGLLAVAADPAGAGWYDLWIGLGCAAGAVLMRGAGCTWNDITDREIDASVSRTRSRPLPSGRVSLRQALIWMALQAMLAFGILLSFPPLAIALGIGSLGLVAIYPFAKRFTWWPQVFLGLAFNWGALLAYAAHAGRVDAAAGLLYLSGIAWTLFYDTIYAHQDREDDALIGIGSTALLFGRRTHVALLVFGALSVGLMGAAIWLALGAGAVWPLVLALCGVALFALHLLWQLRRLDIDRPDICLWLFRANRDAGLVVALFLAGAALL